VIKQKGETEHAVFRRFAVSPFLCFLLLSLAIPILFTGLGAPAFMDHEGRYVEVAREMLLTGDWLTPHLNFAVFLNKPPLPYWLTAVTFLLTGQTEYVRVWIAAAGLLLLLVTILLGQALAGRQAGLTAGFLLLTSSGFFLESRLLRPDLLMTLLLSVTLLGFVKALLPYAPTGKQTWWLTLSAASLAASVMTKGLVNIVLAGSIIGGALLFCQRLEFVRRIRWPLLIVVFGVIVLPWHVAVGMRHEGFWWDYIVNQHFLFFFDKKFPRDSLPDSVFVFWTAFLARLFPWTGFLAPAFWWAVKRAWTERHPSLVLLILWLSVVLGFFTASPSRLEHYSLPALPAAALLIGCWWSAVSERPALHRRAMTASLVLPGAIGALGLFLLPSLLTAGAWTQEFPLLTHLALLVCGSLLVAACSALFLLWRGAVQWSLIVFAGAAFPLFWSIHRTLIAIEPINSWKPIGVCLAEVLPPEGEAVFAASEEYQICGGLNFYSKKPLSILLPNGYIPPPYLHVDRQGSFLTQTDFVNRWQSQRPVVLIIDPDRQENDPAQFAPPPIREIGRWGARRMVANQAFADRAAFATDLHHTHDFNLCSP
jgi:4-amino-4-deoxy-L-arabinose transferase-like glycosyltransferase